MKIDKTEELIRRALIIGEKYVQADKPTKVEVGKLMTGKRRVTVISIFYSIHSP